MLSRCLLGAGIALLLLSFPLMPSIGPFIAIAGLVSMVAGVSLAPRRQ